MIAQTAWNFAPILVFLGSLLIVLGSVRAIRARDRLGAFIVNGALAEAGVACLGWGYGSGAGMVGGAVVLLVQLLARLLAYGALLQLAGAGRPEARCSASACSPPAASRPSSCPTDVSSCCTRPGARAGWPCCSSAPPRPSSPPG